jgi:hypothetical protein
VSSIKAFVLLDMVGDRNLTIRRDANSTPWLVELIWNAAGRVGQRSVFSNELTTIEDDHMPFLRAGVPAVDLIDLDYPQWHTAQDDLDHVSARSLQVVGDVVSAALPTSKRDSRTRRSVTRQCSRSAFPVEPVQNAVEDRPRSRPATTGTRVRSKARNRPQTISRRRPADRRPAPSRRAASRHSAGNRPTRSARSSGIRRSPSRQRQNHDRTRIRHDARVAA